MEVLFFLVVLAGVVALTARPRLLDLSDATIVLEDPTGDEHERKAVDYLREEVKRRSGVEWRVAQQVPADRPAVVLRMGGAGAPEGYSLAVQPSGPRPQVAIVGNDVRGRLFGIGRLLRALDLSGGKVAVPAGLAAETAPQVPVRGHQLASRPKSNSYDAWDKPRFEQYLRDLITFGANALEIIPSIAPDDVSASNEIMPVDPWEMTLFLAETARQYGLGVYLWVPIIEPDILEPDGRAAALERRRRLFAACKRIDSMFVPGGDPGRLHPRDFFPVVAEQAAMLKEIHPHCEVWVSGQNFRGEALDYFYRYLRDQQPDWLFGVVFGPWHEDTIAHMREAVPERYPLRRYPDICHTCRCQYPMRAWDQAFAITANREPINPRPRAYAHIHNLFADYALGFVTYSDGVNDDVNKFVWNVMGWDRGTDIEQALVEYGRVYVSQEMADDIARGILALEQNWEGRAADNAGIGDTLRRWQELERRADEQVRANWRFQHLLLRAYFDAYVQAQQRFEHDLEREALQALRAAREGACDQALAAARAALARADSEHPHREWRQRIGQLADDLWHSIGHQLTVERHHASHWERGAMVTTLDSPLNSRRWIEAELTGLEALDEPGRLAALRRICEWEDPGPGGFYDNLGQRWTEPHLAPEAGWEADPGFCRSAQDEFDYPSAARLSWLCQAQTIFGTPLRMRYQGLDRDASYRLRITYAGRYGATAQTALTANGAYQVHGPLGQSDPIAPVEFDLPREVTADGRLDLEWQRVSGRGIQVAEVWLIKR